MSQRGLICFNRLVYTKGKEELRDLLEDYKECRQIQNAGPLKTFTSDCLNIDGGLWKETFKDELTDNVVPYKGAASNLPLLGIDMGGFEYLHTADEMKRVALAVMQTFGNEERVVYGLDTECCWGENDVRLKKGAAESVRIQMIACKCNLFSEQPTCGFYCICFVMAEIRCHRRG